MTAERIDPASMPRKEIFDFFSGISDPFYSVTFRLDVTELYNYTHSRGISFYYSLCWLVTKAVNSVDAFSYAISGGELVKLKGRSPSFTDMKKGSECFHIVTMSCEGSMEDFCRAAAEKSAAQTELIDMSCEGIDLIFISCLPWLDLTSLTNERDFDPNDAVPRISWGKYREENGRKTLGMSVEVNHRFCDGIHIGRFAQKLEEMMGELRVRS